MELERDPLFFLKQSSLKYISYFNDFLMAINLLYIYILLTCPVRPYNNSKGVMYFTLQ